MDCGGRVTKKTSAKYDCESCGISHYVNPKAAVAVFIINANNELVLAVRAQEPYKGELDCLGGFLDVGENFEQALIRELKEEVSIGESDLLNVTYVNSVYDDYPWGSMSVPVTSAYYVARLKPGAKLEPNDDVADIKIIPADQVNVEDFAWDGMKQAYQALLTLDILA
jgi:ADP-ribose pyrophosphatase YjhB (NUDIX family)